MMWGTGAALTGHTVLSWLPDIYPIYLPCLLKAILTVCFVPSNVLLLRVKHVFQAVLQLWPWRLSFHAGATGAHLYQTLLQRGEKLMQHHQNTLGSSHAGNSGGVLSILLQLLLPVKPSRLWSATGNGGTTSPCPSLLMLARMPDQGTDLAEDEHGHRQDICQIKATVKPQPEGLCLH